MRIFRLVAMAAFITICISLLLMGCEGDTGPAGAPGTPAVSNATCLSAECHGDVSLSKAIVNDLGEEEIIPLYVDEELYAVTVHGDQNCAACHSDINAAGGAHGKVFKTYGSWARFGRKQAAENMPPNEVVRTRNYYTAAATGCVSCHADKSGFANSAHATIFKLREAAVDVELSSLCGITVGENYESGNCNRCHATCATCHFKSTITRLDTTGTPLDYWDDLQANYPNVPGFDSKMTEFEMDWTTNVASHEFRLGTYFANDTEHVCEACHTGFQKPASMAYYWTDEQHTSWDSVKATNTKRHPQTYEQVISGDPSYQSGGNNIVHAGYSCVDCHGGGVGDVHSLAGLDYLWSEDGDVQCVDCHNPATSHATSSVALHFDGTGTEVACIGCHTFGLARDFDSSSGGHDVFLDPVTNEVRPVVYKHGMGIAWYSHNWQTLDPGTGEGDVNSDCAKKCHYAGNVIGATAW